MNYGLYMSASGALTNSYRMDVFANNLANAQTTGFKPHVPNLMHRKPEQLEGDIWGDHETGSQLLEALGGGVHMGPQGTNFALGPLERTERPLDLALTQENQFLVVEHTTPNGRVEQALTRNGRLTTNARGELVTQSGARVLGEKGPIVIPAGSIPQFDQAGNIIDQHDTLLGRIRVVSASNLDGLNKDGDSLFTMADDVDLDDIEEPLIEPGFIEGSAVNPMEALMDLISSTKAVTGNARMMQYADQMLDQAINTFGRVA